MDVPAAHESEVRRPREPPPQMALRTYRCLRLGVLAMLALLAVSITWHQLQSGTALLDSISAYYYTPVQSVFVGTLVTLGFVLIVLWCKTAAEDGALNIAGMLAPVVAFVPTRNEACKAAVVNNVGAYFIVLGLILTVLTVVGWRGQRREPPRTWLSTGQLSYWASLAAAWTLFAVASGTYVFFAQTFFAVAHFTAASLMFALIIAAIVVISREKRHGIPALDEGPDRRWAHVYLTLAATMGVGAVVVGGGVAAWSHLADRGEYWILAVEIWLLFWFAVFWALQTWDRWFDGAPFPSV